MKKIKLFFLIFIFLVLIYFITIFSLLYNLDEDKIIIKIKNTYNLEILKNNDRKISVFPIIKINSNLKTIRKNNVYAKNINIKFTQPHYITDGKIYLDIEEIISNNFILKDIIIFGKVNFLHNYFQNQGSLVGLIDGNYKINGNFFLKTTSEERFLITFFKILFEKLENKKNNKFAISKLIDSFGNYESNINGSMLIKNNIIKTDDIIINNNQNSILLIGNYSLDKNEVDLNIQFKQKNLIYLSGNIVGKINSPLISFDANSKIFDNLNKYENNIFEENIIKFFNKFLDD